MKNYQDLPGGYVTPKLPVAQQEQLLEVAQTMWNHGFRLVVTSRHDQDWIKRTRVCITCKAPVARRRKYCSSECLKQAHTENYWERLGKS